MLNLPGQVQEANFPLGGTESWRDPCMDPLEAFGCPLPLLANSSYGCSGCPQGYQPLPAPDPNLEDFTDYSKK